MDDHDQADLSLLQTFHDGESPQRSTAVEGLHGLFSGDLCEFSLPTGTWRRDDSDVLVQRHVSTVHPLGSVETENGIDESAPQRCEVLHACLDVGEKKLCCKSGFLAVDADHCHHVHGCRRRLDVETGGIKARELVHQGILAVCG